MAKYTLVQFTDTGNYGIKRTRRFGQEDFVSRQSNCFWANFVDVKIFCYMSKAEASTKLLAIKNGAWFNVQENFYKEIPDEIDKKEEERTSD